MTGLSLPVHRPGFLEITDSDMTTQELAAKTAQEIRTRGWTRYNHVNSEGKVCLIAGMNCAAGKSPYFTGTTPEMDVLLNALAVHVNFSPKHVPYDMSRSTMFWWNDRPDRTVEQVLALLDKVASIPLDGSESRTETRKAI